MKKGVNGRKHVRSSGFRLAITSVVVIAFFVILILFYYSMLHSAKRESIIDRGELNAVKSAQRFELYLTTGMDSVKLTTYTVDNMVKKGASHSEILDYMVQESISSAKAIDENYTGIYGYINGEYYDGEMWEPPADYDPVSRPWYTAAVAGKGELVLVDPYLDVETGNITMTLAKALSDGHSVVALDIILTQLQAITEEVARDNGDTIQMVLDSHGGVAAHSDKEQLGRNYFNEQDTIGSEVVKKLYSGNEDKYFELKYKGREYIAYTVPIDNGWYSVSLIDATNAFVSLNVVLIATVIAVAVTVTILLLIFLNTSRKSALAVKLNNQLSTVADIYVFMYDLDIINDTYTEIRTADEETSSNMVQKRQNAQQSLYAIMDQLSMDVSRSRILKFVDFSTLNERLENVNTITEEFLSNKNEWCRGRFILSERRPDGKVSHVIWVTESIDEEKRRRDELQDKSDRAVAANEAKSAFLSNMSHEIRTPINAVLGMNEMILRESDDTNIIAYSRSIKTAGNTLLGLINDILDFSKIEAGKMDIIPVDYELAPLLCDMLDLVRERAENKGLKLKLDCDKRVPCLLHGDEIRIKQIMTNILTNAVKYTEKGSVTITVRYDKLADRADSIALKVAVTDTGIGIRKEDIGSLFTAFERIEEQRNRNIEGTGLGLNITGKLLAMMDSKLEVKSEYGRGSTFGFTIIQRVARWEPVGDCEKYYKIRNTPATEYKETFTAPEAKVLVIDDTPMNLTVFKSLLKKTKIKIDTALSGFDGLRYTARYKYDIIFLDHMMPHKDGVETLRDLKAQDPPVNRDTPVVCLTANAVSGAREKYIAAGFSDYLTKPMIPSQLEDMIVRLLPDRLLETTRPNEENKRVGVRNLISFLNTVSEIDASEGMQYCGDEDIYIDMLKTFRDAAPSAADEINNFWRDKDMKNLVVKIHAMKSSLRLIGASDAGNMAARLEKAARENNIEVLENGLGVLLSKARHISELLAPLE